MSGFDAVKARWWDLPRAHRDLWALRRWGLAIDTDVEVGTGEKAELDTMRTLFQIDGDVLVILPGDENRTRKVSPEMAARHCAHVARRIDGIMLLTRVEGTVLIGALWGAGLAALGISAAWDLILWGVLAAGWSVLVGAVRRPLTRWTVSFVMRRLLGVPPR